MLYIYEDNSPQYIKITGNVKPKVFQSNDRIHIRVSSRVYPELISILYKDSIVGFDSFEDETRGYETIRIESKEKIQELENSAIDSRTIRLEEIYTGDILKNEWFRERLSNKDYPYAYWTYSERLKFKFSKRGSHVQ